MDRAANVVAHIVSGWYDLHIGKKLETGACIFLTGNRLMPRKKKVRAAIPIRAVDFVMCCTRHPKKTRVWYQKLFGLSRGEEWNEFWSEFATEPVTLCLNGPNKSNDPAWGLVGSGVGGFGGQGHSCSGFCLPKAKG